MARLASILKQGFYPAPPEAIAGILRHLKIPDPPPDQKFKPKDVNILDPCSRRSKGPRATRRGPWCFTGPRFRGRAERQPGCQDRRGLSRRAAARPVQLRGDPDHAAIVLAWCTSIRRSTTSSVEAGAKRSSSFVRPSISWCPAASWSRSARSIRSSEQTRMCELLDTWFEQLELYLFPDACRSFRECVVFGRRRKTALTDKLIYQRRHPDEPRHPSMFGRANRQPRSPRRTEVPPMALR